MSFDELEQDETTPTPVSTEIGQIDIPESMQWLMGAFRLVDLHDSARSFGAEKQIITIDRPGIKNKGLWLDVGLQLLHYLANQDLNSPGSFVALAPFSEAILARHTHLGEEDVLFVVRMLSRPTKIWWRPGEYCESGDKAFDSKDTVLIERSRTGELARLAKRGHHAIQIAQASRDWVYAGDVSESIVKALEWNDFSKAVVLCRQMVRSINIEAESVNRAMEQPGMESLRLFYVEYRVRYQETIKNALITLERARDRVSSKQCREGFEEYAARAGEDAVLWLQVEGGLKDLLYNLKGFMDIFVECISAIQKRDEGFIQPIDFLQMSLRMAMSPMSDAAQQMAMNLIIPDPPQTVAPHPIDLRHFIPPSKNKTSEIRPVFPKRDESATSQLGRWLEREAARLEQRLNEGPLSLAEVFEEGFVSENTMSMAEEIISNIHAPPLFHVGNTIVTIGLRGDVHLDLDDGEIAGGNIMIMKVDQEGQRHVGQ